MEGSWNRKTHTCTSGTDFECKKDPTPARCGLGLGSGGALWAPMALHRWST